jgi:tripartite ATP-independent transporter DctM subunit
MIHMSPVMVTVAMLGGLIVTILTGFPLAMGIGSVGLIVGYLAFGVAVGDVILVQIFDLLRNYIILALPLFVFMGTVMEYSGVADKCYEALFLLLGGIRGGLAIVTVLVGTIIAACVGVMTASVTMLTSLSLRSMVKRGYDVSLACGTICAAGSLGILIPPSVMLVVYGPMAGISVGKLFMAAFMPGFLLSALYVMYIVVRCWMTPPLAPTMPTEERAIPMTRKVSLLFTSLFPPAFIILAVLGTIFLGIAPPTDAAAVGVLASILLTIAYRKLNLPTFKDILFRSVNITCMAYLIGAMSVAYTAVFLRAGAGDVIQAMLLNVPGGRWGAFALIQFIYFILGFFIEWIGIFFIMVPIIAPIIPALGFDPVWFGIMICVNLQTSMLTPPYAFAIFVLRAAAPPDLGVTTTDIIRGCIPYVLLIIIGLVLCIIYPEIILWLPGRM